MSLNPIRFGTDVIDQFGRFQLTSFPVADPRLARQFREGLAYGPGTHERLAKGPYVYLNRPFVQGPGIRELVNDPELGLHPALEGLFPFETLHKHQELSLRAALAGRHVVMATGTGSGKTEGFLLPILDHCLKLRDAGAPDGVAAVLIYPMNALVNDQMDRLRPLLAGSRITFGRYTGETPDETAGHRRLEAPRAYTPAEIRRARERVEELPLPWEECASRREIVQRKPRILLTNYAQLEYLLLRDKDLDLFRNAPLRFFVLDEIHTYTGALGSEVACLVRRLRAIAGKSAEEVLCIGSSATVVDRDGRDRVDQTVREFAERLFGVAPGTLDLVEEVYKKPKPSADSRYVPAPPEDAQGLLTEILDAVRAAILADEADEVPEQALLLAERLCGKKAPPTGPSLERLYDLLAPNRMVEVLQEVFTRPKTLEDVLPRVRAVGKRGAVPEEALRAEILAYLTLGTLARRDDEPLMRPKLHYFLQGVHGLWVAWEGTAPRPDPVLHFSAPHDGQWRAFPLLLCRSCGQHFVYGALGAPLAVDDGGGCGGVSEMRPLDDPGAPVGNGEEPVFLTDRIVSQEAEDTPIASDAYLCRHCGAIHDAPGERCLAAKCRQHGTLIPLLRFPAPIKRCPACGARSTERNPVVTPVRSQETYDVMVLAQTMLACMPEPDLRKVLVFADSRQQAAFQAGWMDQRSLRFRVRHLAYQSLADRAGEPLYFDHLVREVVNRATQEGLVPSRGSRRENEIKRLRWILLEEFFAASERQRRNSLEQLGLARLDYDGLDSDGMGTFAAQWAQEFGTTPEALCELFGLVVDVLRLRHAVSDPMLGRVWTERDPEVREGVVTVGDYYRPQIVLRESPQEDRQRRFAIPFRSLNRSSAVERLVAKAFPGSPPEKRDAFLDALWDWLVANKVLVRRNLREWRAGRVTPLSGIEAGYQVNLELIRLRHTDSRFICTTCRTARSRTTPNQACPAYHCDGRLERATRDEHNYDVVQYTRYEFVPLRAREHSAQVPKEDRLAAERAFKERGGKVNCLVATPTLELGVDIGQLEMVLMRNVPPTPANYAQRAGRAGRRHRIAVVFTYCRANQHDQYFYADPPAMIAGEVRIPGFSLRNEPLVRKHVHSAVLSLLRGVDDPAKDEVLGRAFPAYVWRYFGEKDEQSRRLVLEKPDFSDLAELVRRHEAEILPALEQTFTRQWPPDEADPVSPDRLRAYLDEMPGELERVVGTLVAEMKAYQRILREYSERQAAGEVLGEEDRRLRNNYEAALRRRWREEQDNYALTYLARVGFFPGYALAKDHVRAQSLEPVLDVARPLPVALRELTPANRVYANQNQFKVRRLDFYKLKAADPSFEPAALEQPMVLSPDTDRVLPGPTPLEEGGDGTGLSFTSLQMIDVELDGLGRISDQDEYPWRVAFNLFALQMPEHHGGEAGNVGTVPYRFLRNAHLRLVNLGPRRKGPASPQVGTEWPHVGFPICTACGATRSPFASVAEIRNFGEFHERRCGRPIGWHALHVDIRSDLLQIGPFDETGDAINALEAMRIGARNVLEMGDQELEIAILKNDEGRDLAAVYDPIPGGSGFLPLVMTHWEAILERAQEVLERCDCATACYRCLLHFRNQQHHATLDRHRALNVLNDLWGPFEKAHEVPPRFVQEDSARGKQDSPKEEQLLRLLGDRGFPLPPEAQYRLDLGGGTVTYADFAYPDHKVLVYVDGMSERIHGNEDQRRRDRRIRVKAELAGWRVCPISAEGLSDPAMTNDFLERLAILIGILNP